MLKKIFKFSILVAFGLPILVVVLLSLNALTAPNNFQDDSNDPPCPDFQNSSDAYRELQKCFGINKSFSKKYKNQELIALSHYPQLKNTSIEFIEEPAKFPLQSRPFWPTLLMPFLKRHYIVIISNQSLKEYRKILMDQIPLDGQIGVLGHELAHIDYYQRKTSLEIAFVGLKYLFSKSFRNQFERNTDKITILHGLGHQLLAWRNYYERLENKGALKNINRKFYFEDRYLTAAEIINEIEAQKKEAE